jgi:hypothetical protein
LNKDSGVNKVNLALVGDVKKTESKNKLKNNTRAMLVENFRIQADFFNECRVVFTMQYQRRMTNDA